MFLKRKTQSYYSARYMPAQSRTTFREIVGFDRYLSRGVARLAADHERKEQHAPEVERRRRAEHAVPGARAAVKRRHAVCAMPRAGAAVRLRQPAHVDSPHWCWCQQHLLCGIHDTGGVADRVPCVGGVPGDEGFCPIGLTKRLSNSCHWPCNEAGNQDGFHQFSPEASPLGNNNFSSANSISKSPGESVWAIVLSMPVSALPPQHQRRQLDVRHRRCTCARGHACAQRQPGKKTSVLADE